MFRGAANLNLDAKGRMAVPARYRGILIDRYAGQLVVTVDPSRCLLIYPLKNWEEVERKLSRLPSLNHAARQLQRFLIGYASDCELDSNGRIMISQPLREYAGITKKAVLSGQGNKFELWDEERWTAKRDEWMKEVKDLDEIELPEDFGSLSL
ncbi:MAG: transcriptional regulator MraZ [Gammaproteobacteria bacterium]|nr:MAG: transcriptional regulator MraZ [Gammaproteobacteria bacterium]